MTIAAESDTRQEGHLRSDFRSFIDELLVIDGHDHTLPRDEVLAAGDILLHLFVTCCVPRGVVAADPELQTMPFNPDKSWGVLQRHLPSLTNTSAYRCLVSAFKLLYDFDRFPLDEKGYLQLRETMERAYAQEDWYHQALREKAKIDAVMWGDRDAGAALKHDLELFLPCPNLDLFLSAYCAEHKAKLEHKYHVKIQEFGDFIEFLGEVLTQFDEQGVPAFWLSFCQFRPLAVGATGSREAAVVFQKPDNLVTPEEARRFQDFVIHFIADKCASLSIPLQIDTGANTETLLIERSDPCQLAGFVAGHMRTRFVFLHGGYPFARHLGAQAKTFYNIYVDASSLAAHSLSVLRETIGEWVELVPVAKLLIWGGNALRIEETVGSLILTRAALTDVLCERVENGLFSEELAFDLARKLLRDVPRRFYKSEEIRIRRKTSQES